MSGISKQEQAECLRRYGYAEAAALLESGHVDLPPDALKTSWACLQIADALRSLADSKPRWRVTVSGRGSLASISVQADSELHAAFTAGTRFGGGCELVSVDAGEAV